MSTDPEMRVRQYIAALKVPPGPALEHLVKPRRRVAGRLIPVAAALAVLAVIALTVMRPIAAPVASGEQKPGLPDRFASYSYVTAPVSRSAPGTAIALYTHGQTFGMFDHPQALVLGAYGDVYRRIDMAEHEGTYPAPMLLSPDGTRIAMGNLVFGDGLQLIDLTTGRAEKLPVRQGQSSRLMPVAWSSDGRYLAVQYYSDTAPGTAVLYDLTTLAEPTILSEGLGRAAAFSPDGTKLVFRSQQGLRVLNIATNTAEELAGTSSLPRADHLAWSPDGQLLALSTHDRVFFVDSSGSGKPVPSSVTSDGDFVAAWTGPRTLLVRQSGVAEVNVDTGQSQHISDLSSWPNGYFLVGSMQFASNLVLGVQSRQSNAWPDRGPWPTWLALTVTSCAVVLAAAVALMVRRYRARRKREGLPSSVDQVIAQRCAGVRKDATRLGIR